MISAKLSEAIQSYDDEALATLANAGLLRRASRDLDNGKAAFERIEGDTAFVQVDGHTVEIGLDGPVRSACTCPAVGVCRHRLAAVLVLRQMDAGSGADEASADETAEPADPAEWLEEINLDQARKFAGKPGWRAALELADEAGDVVAAGTRVAVTFASLDEPVLILKGQGMAGVVSKATKARQKAFHAASLLVARRHFGLAAETSEDEALASAQSAEKGRLSRPDEAFLSAVRAALGDCAQLGFNLAPLPVEERLFELSVSSRADALPRLSSLLRSVAAQMRLRRNRSFEFDASTMLELAATAYALTHAVRQEGLEARQYLRLAGEIRRNYVDAAHFEVIGCGADIWRASSGARGVTAHFVEPQSGEFFSVALARAAGQDPDFIPRQAFRHQALWNAGTMADLCHARVFLRNTGVAEGGRLSSNREVRAQILEQSASLNAEAPYVHQDWADLQRSLAARFGLGADATGQPQMALIQPVEVARPQFDELAQRLVWPICDQAGRWVALTMDHSEQTEPAIAEIEKRLAKRWRGMMLVRGLQSGDQIDLTPVTLFDGKEPVDLTLVQPERNWAWTGLGKPKPKPDILKWLHSLRPDPGRALTYAPPSRSAAAIMDAWRHVLDRLEAGPKLASQLDGKRAAHAKRLADYGLSALSDRILRAEDGESHLAAAYGLLVARHQRVRLAILQ